jgi:hypothetical protein
MKRADDVCSVPGRDLAAVTVQIPLAALSGLVQAPLPRLVWSDSDDTTIATATGMVRSSFLDLLRAMDRDPDHGHHVLHVTRKRRGVEVEAFVTFLRARYSGKGPARDSAPADDAEEHTDGVDRVLALVGAERVTPSRRRAK